MKRQLIALGLLTASILPIATVHSPAAAATVTIKELEGRVKSAGTLQQTGDRYGFTGTLGQRDKTDSFSFNVPEQGTHTFLLSPDSNLSNESLSIFRGSQRVLSIKGRRSFQFTLKPGVYQLVVEGQSSIGQRKYTADVITPKVTSRKVNVDLISAQGRDKFDRGVGSSTRPDFFVETSMNNVSKPKTKVHKNNNTPRFNHRVSHTLPRSENLVLIKIRLKDSDTGTDGQTADINPSTKSKEITLRYIPTTGKIFNTSDNKLVGRYGVPFSLAGTNGPKATLNLKISHTNHQ